ncbi:MAG TPA: hypothetical protein VGA53_04750 [Candidatus Paceibacterota bacterium]
MEFLLDIVAVVNSPGLQENLFVASLRWLFFMLSAFFLMFIVYVMTTSPTWKEMNTLVADTSEFLSYRPRGLRKVGRQWKKIMARLDTENEAEYKLAIIEADTTLGEALQKMSVSGETTEQRLGQVTKIMIPTVDNVMSAHQIRNSIVYDPNYKISQADTRRVLEIYETAFRGLDLME